MKKYLLIASGFIFFGLSACEKNIDSGISSNNNSTTRTNSSNNTTNTPVPMDQAFWRVGSLVVNGNDLTNTYRAYVFHFNDKTGLQITSDYARYVLTGFWSYSSSNSQFGIDVDESSEVKAPDDLTVFEGTWTVVSFTATTIQLNSGSKQLRFDRIP